MRHRLHTHRRWLTLFAMPALVAGIAIWWLTPTGPTTSPTTFTTGASAPAQVPREVNLTTAAPANNSGPDAAAMASTPDSLGPTPFAGSLEGTDIDGALKTDHRGQLIVDLETRDFFDYFLNTVGEVSPEQALEQIRNMAESSLPREAAAEAMAVLDQYLLYKQRALAVQAIPLDASRQNDPSYRLQMLENAFTELKQLRQGVFSPEVHQAFFGLEEAYGEYTLASLNVAARTDLSAEAKTALVAWHRDQLPAPLQTSERRLMASNEQNVQRMATIQAADSPEAAGQQLMDQGMSPEAAASVTDYLRARESFDARYQLYQDALEQLQASGLSAADRKAQQSQLLHQHFPDSKQQTWARLKMLGSN